MQPVYRDITALPLQQYNIHAGSKWKIYPCRHKANPKDSSARPFYMPFSLSLSLSLTLHFPKCKRTKSSAIQPLLLLGLAHQRLFKNARSFDLRQFCKECGNAAAKVTNSQWLWSIFWRSQDILHLLRNATFITVFCTTHRCSLPESMTPKSTRYRSIPWSPNLTLILRRSRTGTAWFYTSTSNKRAARPKLYTKSLTRDLKRMYSRFTPVRISINL